MDRNNLPNTFEVYSQVIMDQNVSESRNGPPVNLGMKRSQAIADPLRGLGKGLEIAQNRILNHFRLAKGLLAALAIPIYALDAFEDVMNIKAVVLHKGTASCSTRSRISGWSALSSATSTLRPSSSSRSTSRPPGNHGGVRGPASTSKSRSLSSRASPLAKEPNTRTR